MTDRGFHVTIAKNQVSLFSQSVPHDGTNHKILSLFTNWIVGFATYSCLTTGGANAAVLLHFLPIMQ